jgi:hypothetical protein
VAERMPPRLALGAGALEVALNASRAGAVTWRESREECSSSPPIDATQPVAESRGLAQPQGNHVEADNE